MQSPFESSASPKIILETDTSEAPEVTPGPFCFVYTSNCPDNNSQFDSNSPLSPIETKNGIRQPTYWKNKQLFD